jgi:hypothetical protein
VALVVIQQRHIDRAGDGPVSKFGRGPGVDQQRALIAQQQGFFEGDASIRHL